MESYVQYSIAVLAFLHLAKKDGSSGDYTQIIFASLGRNLFEFFPAPTPSLKQCALMLMTKYECQREQN
jgi:hypothetical protein